MSAFSVVVQTNHLPAELETVRPGRSGRLSAYPPVSDSLETVMKSHGAGSSRSTSRRDLQVHWSG
jgi:hypothetical protein